MTRHRTAAAIATAIVVLTATPAAATHDDKPYARGHVPPHELTREERADKRHELEHLMRRLINDRREELGRRRATGNEILHRHARQHTAEMVDRDGAAAYAAGDAELARVRREAGLDAIYEVAARQATNKTFGDPVRGYVCYSPCKTYRGQIRAAWRHLGHELRRHLLAAGATELGIGIDWTESTSTREMWITADAGTPGK